MRQMGAGSRGTGRPVGLIALRGGSPTKGRTWWAFCDSDTGSSDYESAALTAMLKAQVPAFCLGLRLLKPERAGLCVGRPITIRFRTRRLQCCFWCWLLPWSRRPDLNRLYMRGRHLFYHLNYIGIFAIQIKIFAPLFNRSAGNSIKSACC